MIAVRNVHLVTMVAHVVSTYGLPLVSMHLVTIVRDVCRNYGLFFTLYYLVSISGASSKRSHLRSYTAISFLTESN